MASEGDRGETIEEEENSPTANPNPGPGPRSSQTKVPEVEIHLFRRGRGPIDVFRSRLGGWDQNQLEVQDILDKYGFKSLHAFNPSSGRSVAARFNPRNGRSLLPYADGSVVVVDGEPKDSFFTLETPAQSISSDLKNRLLSLVCEGFVSETRDEDTAWGRGDHAARSFVLQGGARLVEGEELL